MHAFFTEREYEGDFPYTDLACERRRADTDIPGVDYKRETGIVGSWERIKISSAEGARSIGRPIGIYDTLQLCRMDLLDNEAIDDASDEVARELCYLLDAADIVPERLLVVGLGNPTLTPDTIGTESARRVKPTMHIKTYDPRLFDTLECSQIAVSTPGVAATSGLDAAVTVRGICDYIEPDAVIVIDSLASRATERLGTTIQISNTGIFPGSGLGNAREGLTEATIGAPVIAIGVPTIIDSRVLWLESGESESRSALGAAREAMFVSPKEINEIAEVAGRIIGGGINQAFGLFY